MKLNPHLVILCLASLLASCRQDEIFQESNPQNPQIHQSPSPVGVLNRNKATISDNLDIVAKALVSQIGNTYFETLVANRAMVEVNNEHSASLGWLVQSYQTHTCTDPIPSMKQSVLSCGGSNVDALKLPLIASAFDIEGILLRPKILFPYNDTSAVGFNLGFWNGYSPEYVGVGMFSCGGGNTVQVWGKDHLGNPQRVSLPKSEIRNHVIWVISLDSDLDETDEPIGNFFKAYNDRCTCSNTESSPSPEGKCVHNQSGTDACGTYDAHTCTCLSTGISCTVVAQ